MQGLKGMTGLERLSLHLGEKKDWFDFTLVGDTLRSLCRMTELELLHCGRIPDHLWDAEEEVYEDGWLEATLTLDLSFVAGMPRLRKLTGRGQLFRQEPRRRPARTQYRSHRHRGSVVFSLPTDSAPSEGRQGVGRAVTAV